MSHPASASPSLTPVVWAAGIGQLIGYGTIFYSYALVAPGPSAEFGVSLPVLFGILSAATLLSGLAGPLVGRLIDRMGGANVMAIGSLVCSALFFALALSPDIWTFGLLVMLLQIASVTALYSAAAPTISQFGGPNVQRAIVLVTLLMGISSTVFWPITSWLMPVIGWRWTYALFGLLNLAIATPCYGLLAIRRRRIAAPAHPAGATPGVETLETGLLRPEDRRFGFWAVTTCVTLSSFLSLSLAVHFVPLLSATGVGDAAWLIGMLMGPTQVAVRIAQATLFRGLTPMHMAYIMAISLPLSLLAPMSGLPPLLAGIVFALLYGIAQGFAAIVLGTLPLVLFGRKGFGERLGRITMYRAIFTAPAAFILSALWESFGLDAALVAFTLVGSGALIPLLMLRARLRRSPA